MDVNRLTLKSQEALAGAQRLAAELSVRSKASPPAHPKRDRRRNRARLARRVLH